MLYNPAWEPPSLDGFISFLETVPPEEEYFWADCGKCVIGQYFRSIGKTYGVFDTSDANNLFAFNRWEYNIACPTPHTFGAALERARKVQKSRKELEPCR